MNTPDRDALPTVAVDSPVPATASVFADEHAEARTAYAADWVASALRDVFDHQDRAVLGLVGGSSVADVHAALVDTDVDWSRVVITQADERAVPAASEQRNWRVIEPLVDPLLADGRLPGDNIVALGDLPADPDVATVHAALDVLAAKIDRVDVALLAAGPDGHCASLFPHHPGLASAGSFAVITNSPKPPPLRVSMTVPMLAGATASLLIGFGDAKADAMATVASDGPLSDAPARVVHLAAHGVIVTDRIVGQR